MKPFKFLTICRPPVIRQRRWIGTTTPGRIYWMNSPVGNLHYVEESEIYEGEYTMSELQMQLRSMQVMAQSRHITSIDDFMQRNIDKIVVAYQFVVYYDITDLRFGIITAYDENNFHEAPRNIRMIFRGVVRNTNVM